MTSILSWGRRIQTLHFMSSAQYHWSLVQNVLRPTRRNFTLPGVHKQRFF